MMRGPIGRGVRREFRASAGGRGLLVLASVVVIATATGTSKAFAEPGEWSGCGSLAVGRFDHAATALPSGSLLVTGGVSGTTPTASTERYDTESRAWARTASLTVPRSQHTSTAISDGRVLVAGGLGGVGVSGALGSVEVYNPATGSWMAGLPLSVPRYNHTATILQDGAVLVAAGRSALYTAAAERFDPETGAWTPTGSLNQTYYDHTATRLVDGNVLVVGATPSGSSAEVYDAKNGVWTKTAAPVVLRFDHTATLLGDGRVLVVGTAGGTEASGEGRSAEIYDPSTSRWSPAGQLSFRRAGHAAALLPGGEVLVASGRHSPTAEVLDVATGAWRQTGSLSTVRDRFTLSVLPDASLLAAGGQNAEGGLRSSETYGPEGRAQPVLSVGDVAVSEGDDGTGMAHFTVSLSRPASVAVSVGYATSDLSALAGHDYLAVRGTVNIEAGGAGAIVTVPVKADVDTEGAEEFALVMTSPAGAVIGDGHGVGTIIDDEDVAGRRLAVGSVSVTEGDAGTRWAVFSVTLDRPSQATVTVNYSTEDLSAAANLDYEAGRGTLRLNPGTTSRTIAVAIHPDAEAEGDESFAVVLSDARGARVTGGRGTGTIVDDDTAGAGGG